MKPSAFFPALRSHGVFLGLTALALWVLWIQAGHDLWIGHLRIDPVVYQARAAAFLDDHSWSDLGVNEYQPGALWFFVSVAAVAGDRGDFDSYLRALAAVNLFLICVHLAIASACGGKFSAWWMLLFAVLTGPILLFRFELLVSALVLSAWVFWRMERFAWAGLLFGLATATKVYPVLFFPLLFVSAWRAGGGWRKCAASVTAWAAGGFLVVGASLLAGASWADLVASLQFHFDKPFGIEGALGTLVPLWQALLGIPLRMAPRNGVYGFDPDLGPIPVVAVEWMWLAAVLWVLWLLLRRGAARSCAEPGALFVLVGLFVGLGKLMTPQYTWWAVSLLPLASSEWFRRGEWRALVAALSACLLAGQFIYPLNYSEFIACFDGDLLSGRLFWINALKNALWLGALGIALKALWRETRAPAADLC